MFHLPGLVFRDDTTRTLAHRRREEVVMAEVDAAVVEAGGTGGVEG